MRIALCVLVALAVPVTAADKTQPLTAVDLKGKEIAVVQPKEGNPLQPTEIKTTDELTKSPLFAESSIEKVKKEVNFEKEKLVVFAWSGSGRDVIAGVLVTEEKKATAQFTYTPGATKDNRPHFRLFVVPKDAEMKVERAQRVPKE